MILEEFDESKKAIINPSDVIEKVPNFPKIAISCFSQELFNRFLKDFKTVKLIEFGNANGRKNIYKINYEGLDIAIYMAGVGAPIAASEFDELIHLGVNKLIIFGTCGVLDSSIDDLAIIIPTSAIRDEGTSYHYEKASREIKLNDKYIEEFESILKNHNVSYVKGKTWTIDAFYRETEEKKKIRKNEGCIAVDMEASALKAVANFRNKEIFQFFYAADNLDNANWDKRSLSCKDKLDAKEKILKLSLELAKKIGEE